MDFWIGPIHSDLLLGQGHTKGIASATSETMMERSRVRALHCLQHRLGSGGHWEGVLQQSQQPFVVRAVLRPCSTMGRCSFSVTGTESHRRCLSLFQAPWRNLSSNPLQTRRKENLQPPASNLLVPYLSFHCHHLFPSPALGWPSPVLSGLLSLFSF